MWTVNFQMFKLDFEKADKPEIKLPTSAGSLKKHESSKKKKPTSALLTMPKPLTVWATTNSGKLLKSWEYQTTWEVCMQVRKQQLELDMEQQMSSKQGKKYVKAVYCHMSLYIYIYIYMPIYIYIGNILYIAQPSDNGLDEAQTGIKIARKDINNLRYADDTTLMAESKRN